MTETKVSDDSNPATVDVSSNNLLEQEGWLKTVVEECALDFKIITKSLRDIRILRAYRYGQSFSIVRSGLWWSSFGLLSLVLLSSSPTQIQDVLQNLFIMAISISRVPFNLGLVFFAPFAACIVRRYSIRTLLLFTTVGRGVLSILLVFLCWMLYLNEFIGFPFFLTLFVSLVLVDGALVGLGNIVDIDCDGIDMIYNQYEISLTQSGLSGWFSSSGDSGEHNYVGGLRELRSQITKTYQQTFDLSFVLFTPFVSALLFGLTFPFPTYDVFIFTFGVTATFLFLSLVSFFSYFFGLPRVDFKEDNQSSPLTTQHKLKLGEDVLERFKAMAVGFRLILNNQQLMWRLLFLSIETALEDIMICAYVPIIGVALSRLRLFGFENVCYTNFFCSAIIAFGKFGAFFSNKIAELRWRNRSDSFPRSYESKYFWFTFCGSLAVFPMSAGLYLASIHYSVTEEILAIIAIVLSSAVFFGLSVVPRVGLGNLLEVMIDEAAGTFSSDGFSSDGFSSENQEAFAKVCIGTFIGSFVTTTDAVILALFNLLFFEFTLNRLFGIVIVVSCLYAFCGLTDLICGVQLVSQRMNRLLPNTLQTDSIY